MRAYFYDAETGQELTEHELNGCQSEGNGPMAALGDKCYKNTCTYIDGAPGHPGYTCEDFGNRAVIVKHWMTPEHYGHVVMLPTAKGYRDMDGPLTCTTSAKIERARRRVGRDRGIFLN